MRSSLNENYNLHLNIFQSYTLPFFFGHVNLSEVNTVESVAAVGVAYFLDSSDAKSNLGDEWEKKVLDSLLEHKTVYAPDLEVRLHDILYCEVCHS